jgi:hypothetical protein
MTDELLTHFRERNEQMLAAGRHTQLELLAAFEQAATAFAASEEMLAERSEVEWLSRLLRAQAILTRELADFSGRFARELLETHS